MLRQQHEKPAGQFNHCLADYIAPRESGRIDYIGRLRRHRRATASRRSPPSSGRRTDDYNAIMAQALGDRLAEAMAEMFHKQRARGVRLREDREPDPRGADPGKIPRDPAGAGLSRVPRPHGEAVLFGLLGGRGRDRHPPHGELRDGARPAASAAGTSIIPTPSTSGSASSAATRSRTMPGARAGSSRRPSNGSGPTWITRPAKKARTSPFSLRLTYWSAIPHPWIRLSRAAARLRRRSAGAAARPERFSDDLSPAERAACGITTTDPGPGRCAQ